MTDTASGSPDTTGLDGLDHGSPGGDSGNAEGVFSKSVIISGVRCLLFYVLFPFVAPLVGVTASVGAVLGVIIGVVAIFFNVWSIRRFFASGHPYRWWASAMNVAVIILLLVLFVLDSQTLLG